MAVLGELFLMLNAKSVETFGKITFGVIALLKTNAAATVAVAVAAVPFETPSVVVMAPAGILLIKGVPDV